MVLRTTENLSTLIDGCLTDPSFSWATDRYRNTGSPTPATTSNLPLSIKAIFAGVERSVTESLGAVTDATERLLRRSISISEPSISVSDATARAIRRVKDVSEPSISVSDVASAGLFKKVNVSEPAISASDMASYILLRSVSVSESISVSDLVTAEKFVLLMERSVNEPNIAYDDDASLVIRRTINISEPSISVSDDLLVEVKGFKERDVSEPFISVFDVVSVFRIKEFTLGVFKTDSETEISETRSEATGKKTEATLLVEKAKAET